MSKLIELLLKIIDLISKLFVGKDNNLNNTPSKQEEKESPVKDEVITENLETGSEIDSEAVSEEDSKPVEKSNFNEKLEQIIELDSESKVVLEDKKELKSESENKQNSEQESVVKDLVVENDFNNETEIILAEKPIKNDLQNQLQEKTDKKDDLLLTAINNVKNDIKVKVHEINKKYKESVEAIDNWEKQRLKEIAEEEKEIERLSGDSREEDGVIDITPKTEPKSSKIDIKNDSLIQKTHELTDKFNQLLKQKGIK